MAVQNTLSLILGRLEDFSQKVRDNLVQADWHLQRELIRLLVKRVEIDQEAINVVFRIAPELPRPDGQNGPDRNVLQDCGWGIHISSAEDFSGRTR